MTALKEFERPQTTADLWPTKSAAQRRQPTNGEMFAKLDADLFLAHQLFRAGRSARVLEGITVPADRRERIRREILATELQDKRLRAPSGFLDETFAQAFLRLYHEPLQPQHSTGDEHEDLFART